MNEMAAFMRGKLAAKGWHDDGGEADRMIELRKHLEASIETLERQLDQHSDISEYGFAQKEPLFAWYADYLQGRLIKFLKATKAMETYFQEAKNDGQDK